MKKAVATLLLATLVVGCAGETGGYKEPGGALLGGAAGALAGSQFGGGRGQLAATGAGALLGALIGQQAGRSLDRSDYLYNQQRAQGIPQQVGQPMPNYGYFGAPMPYNAATSRARQRLNSGIPEWSGGGCQPVASNDPWAAQAYVCPGPNGLYLTR